MAKAKAATPKKTRKGWSEKSLLKYLNLYLSENNISDEVPVGEVIQSIKDSIIDSL